MAPSFKSGDVIHCEAERDEGKVRIGFAKNYEPLGVAYDMDDDLGDSPLVGIVCGKGSFKARLISAECVPIADAPEAVLSAELPGYVEYDPPRPVEAIADHHHHTLEEEETYLHFFAGDSMYVSADDGEGYLFGFFLDPDDGGWFPASCVQFSDTQPMEGEVGENQWSGDAGGLDSSSSNSGRASAGCI